MILLEQSSEILTDKGEFPACHLVGQTSKVWNGSRWIEIKIKKETLGSAKYSTEFIGAFTYEGCSVKGGILIESKVVGNFLFDLKNGIKRSQETLEIGDTLNNFDDNSGRTYSYRFVNRELLDGDNFEFFQVDEKVNFIVDGVMVWSF